MNNNTIKILKKQGLLAWSVLVTFTTLNLFSANADYPLTLSTMKRVARIATNQRGSLFSSNILLENGESSYVDKSQSPLSLNEITQGQTYNVNIDLFNYDTFDMFSKYPDDIAYELKFEFTDKNGNALTQAQVTHKNGDETGTQSVNRTVAIQVDGETLWTLNDAKRSYSQNMTFSKNASVQSITMQFSNNWDLENDEDICVKVTAKPDSTTTSGLNDLGAIIGLKKEADIEPAGWTVYLSEHSDDNSQNVITNYDGFNIVAEGAGKADIIITIGTSEFGINKFFYEATTIQYSVTTVNENNESVTTTETKTYKFDEVSYSENTGILTIHANSYSIDNDYRNRYNIQLYYKNGIPENLSWSKLFSVKKEGIEPPSNWNDAYVKVEITTPTSSGNNTEQEQSGQGE